ncbi:nuclear transport factor 2 family protein [Sulfitobacter sp. 1151]|uniref:Nuclear transport factor 2 family protein n=1 Tax=Parasulfitobacter algicola TaxID=2614809 RepID=A0ABX2ISV3_9RHOB|nr:nuclear transport factor 2 family protein [Sulfitobacter algicola]NSX55635.1 nuclear transport factor 2 family protein [Sulfitobacter algicola]
MDLKGIAEELVSGCREGREAENLDKLYAKDVVSVEAMDFSGQGREVHGIDAIKGKHAWWADSFEVHSQSVDGPFLHGDAQFAVVFDVDCTEKQSGNRMKTREVGVYHVADGKITREEFFYSD